jgi:hypothetical protein
MNILTVILNRVYLLLVKVKNQSPFFGAIVLVGLLFNVIFDNLITITQLIGDKPNKTNGLLYYSTWIIITILVYLFARKRKTQIVEVKLSTKFNFIVSGIFLLTLILVIWCGNLNREKLSKEQTEFGVKPQKKSLEGRIRKWFDER